ncbi:MAG: DUF4440 domain-containing protein [Acidobacteria bacterium]|nr:DUF4440 domain-containing protein [Acidobacteriota bacterium]MBI3487851.1 DUF4440 domain-containing protein [Acidobacteriota bacterium]
MSTSALEDVQATIHAANARFSEAMRQRDAVSLASLYTTQGQLFPPHGEPVTGQPGIQRFWGMVIGMGIDDADLRTGELEVHEDTAIECGHYVLRAGGHLADEGKYLVVWKQSGGAWKLHRDIWNTSQPPKG